MRRHGTLENVWAARCTVVVMIIWLVCPAAIAADVKKLVDRVDSAVVVLKTLGRDIATAGGQTREVAARGLGTGVLVDPLVFPTRPMSRA